MIDISDFVTEGPVPAEIIERYRDRVPEDVVEMWERYGYGSFAEGFLRVIDPAVHEEALAACLGKVVGERISIPIMTTAMADLVVWEPGEGLNAILYRLGKTAGLANTVATFVRLVERNGAAFLDDAFAWKPYPKAVAAHGAPAFDESFMFVPLLSLGGSRAVKNLKPRDTITAIQIMVEFQGVVEH